VKQMLIAIALIATAGFEGLAHTGPHEKIMGTVVEIHDGRMEVKATTGKQASIILTDQTKIWKGTHKSKPTEIKEGDRVVVTAVSKKGSDGKTVLTAEEVRLAAGATTNPK
jgi:hypothetical protein